MTENPSPQPSAQQIFNEIVQRILAATEPTEMVYTDVDPDDGLLICRMLEENREVERENPRTSYNSKTRHLFASVMRPVHYYVPPRWMLNSIINWLLDGGTAGLESMRGMNFGIGQRLKNFTGPYASSVQQPDFYMSGSTMDNPTIVVESGWPESLDRLQIDKDLWLRGTTKVEIVVLVIWSETEDDKVEGTVEVWTRDGADDVAVRRLAIFPAPDPLPTDDRVEFTKGQLFGPAAPLANPTTILSLEMSELRRIAQQIISKIELSPA
ncbi:hypothetical protein BO78DRAFT_359823 [Aspergillus sclerotiicarbonarius CBS 121057]|uniref:Uncharacterized protein n=1 Tax=Aspergillus sclerotiicarbonarius (strain CBS 121057 / IBT 28362) TaxID=1448318 RepID=A0A319ELV4_ASPSB|nr:hypothetical protein BO78DRAFT_359823 [Aspergillus sclerotiicarbonarius CBS 121057]